MSAMNDTRWSARWAEKPNYNKASQSQLTNDRPRLPPLSSLLASKSNPWSDQQSQDTGMLSSTGDGKGIHTIIHPSLAPAEELGGLARPELHDKFESLGKLNYFSPRRSAEQQVQHPDALLFARKDRRDQEYQGIDTSRQHTTESRPPLPPSRWSSPLQADASTSMNALPTQSLGLSVSDSSDVRSNLASVTNASKQRSAMSEWPSKSQLLNDCYRRSESHHSPPHSSSDSRHSFYSNSASIPRHLAPHSSQVFPDWQQAVERDALFDRLLNVFLAARRYTHTPSTDGSPLACPSVRQGDVSTLIRYLELELDKLHVIDPRMAKHLKLEWHRLLNQFTSFDTCSHHVTEYPSQPHNAMSQGPSPQFDVHGGSYTQACYVVAASMSKRVRKRPHELDQICLACSASETPEWRKGPTGPRTLCNACGLLYAKQCRKRKSVIRSQNGKSKGVQLHPSERMTNEESENSLRELQMAVQARSKQAQSFSGSMNTIMANSSLSPTTFNRPSAREVDRHRE